MNRFGSLRKKMEEYQDKGKSKEFIENFRDSVIGDMREQGYSEQEVVESLMMAPPDSSLYQKIFQENINKYYSDKAVEAQSFGEVLEAGWDISVTGLMQQGKSPDVYLPSDSPWYHRIPSQMATLIGDAPAIAAGASAGMFYGGPPGAMAGGFAVPAWAREALLYDYKKGVFDNPGNFWEAFVDSTISGLKGGAIGLATWGAGKLTRALPIKGKPMELTAFATEAATMTAVGAALAGEMPTLQDFIDAGVVLGTARLAGAGANKVKLRRAQKHFIESTMRIYKETGVLPKEVIEIAKSNPRVMQEMTKKKAPVPTIFKDMQAIREGQIKNKAPSQTKKQAERLDVEGKDVADVIVEKKPEKTNLPSKEEIYQAFVDDLIPIEYWEKKIKEHGGTLPKQSVYETARLLRGANGKVEYMIKYNTVDYHTLKPNGKGLFEIIKPIQKAGRIDDFVHYMTAKRLKELHGQGRKIPADIEKVETLIKEKSAEFEAPFRELVDFQNRILDYYAESGIISKAAAKEAKTQHKDFVPVERDVIEPKHEHVSGRSLLPRNALKSLSKEGSQLDIINPLSKIIENTFTKIRLAERNRVMTKLTEMVKLNPDILGQYLVEKSKIDYGKKKPSDVSRDVPELVEAQKIFTPERNPEVTIVGFKNGERVEYITTPEMVLAVRGMDAKAFEGWMGGVVKYSSIPAKLLRAGVVLDPAFLGKNLFRDTMAAGAYSKNRFIPVLDSAVGALYSLFKGKYYKDWLLNGGANSTLVSADKTYLSSGFFDISRQYGIIENGKNVLKSPVEGLQFLSEWVENSTKVGEYRRAIRMGKTPEKAAYESRDLHDFARIGAYMRILNQVSAFTNAQIQGLDKTHRAFRDDPLGLATRGAFITSANLALWWLNKDDPRYDDLTAFEKDNYLIFMTDDEVFKVLPPVAGYDLHDEILKVPGPFELQILFGAIPRRMAEQFIQDNPYAWEDFDKTMRETLMLNLGWLPNVATVPLEIDRNRTYFSNRKLIPSYLDGAAPDLQIKPWTSETAIMISKFVDKLPVVSDTSLASPIIIDHVIDSWTGGLGRLMKSTMDAMIPDELTGKQAGPTPTLGDLPVIKAFVVRHPSMSSQKITRFYKNLDKAGKAHKSLKILEDDLGQYMDRQDEFDFGRIYGQLRSAGKIISDMSKYIRTIHKNKTMTPDEKREAIDRNYMFAIKIADEGNKSAERFIKIMEKYKKNKARSKK